MRRSSHARHRRHEEGAHARRAAGHDTRPTSDRVRENIFNLVGPLDGAAVLDLFAGSGAMGIEALSRGAASAVFVEHDADAVRTIERNLDKLRLTGARVVRGDVLRTIAQEATAGAKYDLVLVDPPYGMLDDIQPRLARHLPPLARAGRPHRLRDRRAQRARAAAARAYEPQVRPDARHALRGAAVITAIAPGSYDPVTNGHVDVITRAAGIFDRVVVGVVGTPRHKEPMFAVEERVEFSAARSPASATSRSTSSASSSSTSRAGGTRRRSSRASA